MRSCLSDRLLLRRRLRGGVMDEPKKCPFCRGEASVLVENWGDGRKDIGHWLDDMYYVECQACHVRTSLEKCASDAIAAWNRREE